MAAVQRPPKVEESLQNPAPPANSREYLARQPSKLADELNPFEKSFSRPETSAEAEAATYVAGSHVKGGRVLRGAPAINNNSSGTNIVAVDATSSSSQQTNSTAPSSDTSVSTAQQKLPSITSITSSDGIDDSIPSWSAANVDATARTPSLESSLRSGPLSPAMLTAPQNATVAALRSGTSDASSAFRNGIHNHTLAQHNGAMTPFDPSQFVRTGLTPGATGLTPLTGSNPSGITTPNTAAFLAMVNNATSGVGMDATGPPLSDLTPGTHSAIYGVVNGFSFENPSDVKPTVAPEQPDYFSHRPSSMTNHVSHIDQAQQPPNSQPYHNTQHYPQQPQYVQPDQYGMMPPPAAPQQQHYNPQQASLHQLQQQIPAPLPSPSENGLLLLTQAHQELSKREKDVLVPATRGAKKGKAAQVAAAESNQASISPRTIHSISTSSTPVLNGNNKRKAAEPAPARASTPKRGGKKAKNSAPPTEDGESDDDLVVKKWDDVKNKPGPEGETEEEKRKNFLERNRQAALKCRQRKKAWLNQLQAKVEFLTAENESLTQTNTSLRDDVTRLSTILLAHRDCPVAPKLSEMAGVGYGIGIPSNAQYQNGPSQAGHYATARV